MLCPSQARLVPCAEWLKRRTQVWRLQIQGQGGRWLSSQRERASRLVDGGLLSESARGGRSGTRVTGVSACKDASPPGSGPALPASSNSITSRRPDFQMQPRWGLGPRRVHQGGHRPSFSHTGTHAGTALAPTGASYVKEDAVLSGLERKGLRVSPGSGTGPGAQREKFGVKRSCGSYSHPSAA